MPTSPLQDEILLEQEDPRTDLLALEARYLATQSPHDPSSTFSGLGFGDIQPPNWVSSEQQRKKRRKNGSIAGGITVSRVGQLTTASQTGGMVEGNLDTDLEGSVSELEDLTTEERSVGYDRGTNENGRDDDDRVEVVWSATPRIGQPIGYGAIEDGSSDGDEEDYDESEDDEEDDWAGEEEWIADPKTTSNDSFLPPLGPSGIYNHASTILQTNQNPFEGSIIPRTTSSFHVHPASTPVASSLSSFAASAPSQNVYESPPPPSPDSLTAVGSKLAQSQEEIMREARKKMFLGRAGFSANPQSPTTPPVPTPAMVVSCPGEPDDRLDRLNRVDLDMAVVHDPEQAGHHHSSEEAKNSGDNDGALGIEAVPIFRGSHPMPIAVVGNAQVGKSTLIKREPICLAFVPSSYQPLGFGCALRPTIDLGLQPAIS